MAVELLRRQDHGDDRHFGFELNLHQTVEDGAGDELVPVDAAIDDEAGGDDRGVVAGLGQQLRLQGNLVAAGHVEDADPVRRSARRFEGFEERLASLVDDILVPVRLHEGDMAGPESGAKVGDAGVLVALAHDVPLV